MVPPIGTICQWRSLVQISTPHHRDWFINIEDGLYTTFRSWFRSAERQVLRRLKEILTFFADPVSWWATVGNYLCKKCGLGTISSDSGLTRNFGKMTFLRYLGKSVRLKAYPRTVRCVKRRSGSGGFCLGFFVLKRSPWTLFLEPFPRAKTTYKLLWNSKNITNITKALNARGNMKKRTVSWPNWEIRFSWENDAIRHLWGLVKTPVKHLINYPIVVSSISWIFSLAALTAQWSKTL